jgi:hypothetical protein
MLPPMTTALTLIDVTVPHEVQATLAGDAVRVPVGEIHRTLGWELKPEGLCREATCVPVRDRRHMVFGDTLDLAALAAALDRPLALDLAERTAVLGASAGARAAGLASTQAPDFALPDLAGTLHALSDYAGKKKLLIAWASW